MPFEPQHAIEFTQYLRPDGRKTTVYIKRHEDIYKKAKKLIDRGYKFECEQLTTGHASLTVADPEKGEDIAIRVVTNGPVVPHAVDSLIDEAYQKTAGRNASRTRSVVRRQDKGTN